MLQSYLLSQHYGINTKTSSTHHMYFLPSSHLHVHTSTHGHKIRMARETSVCTCIADSTQYSRSMVYGPGAMAATYYYICPQETCKHRGVKGFYFPGAKNVAPEWSLALPFHSIQVAAAHRMHSWVRSSPARSTYTHIVTSMVAYMSLLQPIPW